jgi:hypothetical protein
MKSAHADDAQGRSPKGLRCDRTPYDFYIANDTSEDCATLANL